MRTALAAMATLALLAACTPQDPNGDAAAPPADAPPPEPEATVSDFGQPMTALGTEPFWNLSLDGTTLTLKRMDKPDAVFEAPGAAIQPGQATWTAKGPKGEPLILKLFISECSDGMSDAKYPMAAEVEMAGETLRGCAAKTAEMPKGQ